MKMTKKEASEYLNGVKVILNSSLTRPIVYARLLEIGLIPTTGSIALNDPFLFIKNGYFSSHCDNQEYIMEPYREVSQLDIIEIKLEEESK